MAGSMISSSQQILLQTIGETVAKFVSKVSLRRSALSQLLHFVQAVARQVPVDNMLPIECDSHFVSSSFAADMLQESGQGAVHGPKGPSSALPTWQHDQ